MSFSLVGLVLVLFAFATGTHVKDEVKRQAHGADAANSAHTNASDPLAAWMSSTSSKKPNVLFLIADDLRPKLGCYGETNMVTPNLNLLASKSVLFKQAFAQIALCAPSRTSFLTGRRPETTRVFDLHTYFRKVAGDFTTMPEYFKHHGYNVQSVGKIFHPGEASGGTFDYPQSWTSTPYEGVQPFNSHQRKQSSVHPVDETKSGKLLDTTIADFAVNFLRTHAHNHDQPFFLAVGFHKPHLPWIFPQQYLDLYPLSNIHLAANRTRPPQMPDLAWSASSELHSFHDIAALHTTGPNRYIPDSYQYKIRQAYSAATSFMDALVGRVLKALSQHGFADNTIVAFMGDHGWHLGDNGEWCKHTNFEMALRIPMILYVPGVTTSGHNSFHFIDAVAPGFDRNAHPREMGPSHSTDELVEAVDLFATLTELAGLPVPHTCPDDSLNVALCTEGTSLVPLVKKVRGLSGDGFRWKDAAYSVYHRKWEGPHPVLGYTVRTKTHRYTEWVHYDRTHFRPDFTHVLATELYRHSDDPFEFHNRAKEAAFSGKVSEMSKLLRAGWRSTLQSYLNSVH